VNGKFVLVVVFLAAVGAVIALRLWGPQERELRELRELQQEIAGLKGQADSAGRRAAIVKIRERIVALGQRSGAQAQAAWKAFLPLAAERFALAKETSPLLPEGLRKELVTAWFERQAAGLADRPPKDLARAAWDLLDGGRDGEIVAQEGLLLLRSGKLVFLPGRVEALLVPPRK
jgi:HAMP domain-containing protein